MVVVKKFSGEKIVVTDVSEIVISTTDESDENSFVIEVGGWGAGYRVTLPQYMNKVGVFKQLNERLAVTLGY